MKSTPFYIIMRPILLLYIKTHSNAKYINSSIIPKKGKVVLAGNHTHDYDALLLGSSTPRCVRFIAKKELMKGPIGILFKWLGIIPVDRSIHDKSVIPAAINLLNKNALLGIFPEGTINRTQDIIMPFKAGAVKMSLESHSPIIPFAITGKYGKKNNITIRFGDLYYPQTEDVEKETHILENKVIELLKSDGEIKK